MENSVFIGVRAGRRGQRYGLKAGFNIFPPKADGESTEPYWAVYSDDGRGNGERLAGGFETLAAAVGYAVGQIDLGYFAK